LPEDKEKAIDEIGEEAKLNREESDESARLIR